MFLVGAGPGDPGLLTLRAAEVLESTEVLLYDALAGDAIVAFAPPPASESTLESAPGARDAPKRNRAADDRESARPDVASSGSRAATISSSDAAAKKHKRSWRPECR